MSDKTNSYAQYSYNSQNKIADRDILSNPEEFNPWQLPENPFDYVALLNKLEETKGENFIENERNYGKRVAIVGAGCAGTIAARELMRVGLHPIVYEASERIGGRTYSYPFKADPHAIVEMGAMRIPTIHRTVYHLLDSWGIKYKTFPDPLVVNTQFYLNGKNLFYDSATQKYHPEGKLVQQIKQITTKWHDIIDPITNKMREVWDNPSKRREQWKIYVEQYKNKILFEVLNEAGWTEQETDLFAVLGVGSGGFGPFYENSFLEILRIEIHLDETDQQLIIGGVSQIPLNLWEQSIDCTYWGNICVAKLQDGGIPRSRVTEIVTDENNPQAQVLVRDDRGNEDKYDAVIICCSLRALEMNIKINRSTFKDDVWNAIRNFPLTNSGKIAILTKTAFWKEPQFKQLCTTLTDLPIQQAYFFDSSDFGSNTEKGVVILSYSWSDSATKFDALGPEQRLALCFECIEEIYGPEVLAMMISQTIEHFVWSWEEAYGYHGAFRMAYPGQEAKHWALFNQGKKVSESNGVYLAGEAIAWLGLSGWIEGALQTGLDAFLSVTDRVNNLRE